MPEFQTVGKTSEVPEGEARAFQVGDRDVAVANLGETWYAIDDTCSHRQCSISEGEIEETSIICPCHGGTYDLRTGEVLAGPPPEDLQTFEIKVEGDEIQVAV